MTLFQAKDQSSHELGHNSVDSQIEDKECYKTFSLKLCLTFPQTRLTYVIEKEIVQTLLSCHMYAHHHLKPQLFVVLIDRWGSVFM